jgi:hypothetical protein
VPDYAECVRNEYCVSLNPVDEIVERFRVEEQTWKQRGMYFHMGEP